MKLVVITPVRNGTKFIDRYFDNVEQYADSIVFLDDGSTDDTYDLIKDHPLVEHIMRNPKRDSTVGWSHTQNIYDLHKYVQKNMKDYEWILLLDINKNIQPTHRIKDLMNFDYELDFAFGFFWHSAAENGEYYRPTGPYLASDPSKSRVWCRPLMWENRPHYTIKKSQLNPHGREIPEQIQVSFSSGCLLLHYGSATYEDRLERYNKYTKEVDPDNEFQSSYENIHPDNEQYYFSPIKI